MNIVKDVYSGILIITVLLSIIFSIYAYKRRKMPSAKNFIVLMVFVIIYNAGYVFELNATEFSKAFFWYNIEHIGMPMQPYFWMLISLDFTGTPKNKQKPLKCIALIYPVIYYIGFFTNSMHHLYDISYKFESNGYFPVIITEKGPLYSIIVTIGTLVGILIVLVYLKNCFKASRIYRYSYIIMILASIFPWFSEYFYQSQWNNLKLDYFPIAVIISEVIYMYGIFRLRIMSTVPIAHNMIFNQSKDAILLVDINDYIIDMNSTFIKLFPKYNSALKNKTTLSKFLSVNLNIKCCLKNNYSNTFSMIFDKKINYYNAEMRNISIENNIIVGKMLIISDVTMFIENQKILESAITKAVEKAESNEVAFLQAQINPHFLNNTLSLISSMVSRDPQKAKDTIANLSEYLMNCYQFDVNEPMISLKEELDFVNIYVTIEKTRFMSGLMLK